MFQVLKFNTDPMSGVTHVKLQYDLTDGRKHTEAKDFVNEDIAAKYANNAKKKYLIENLKKFVTHKKVLSEKSELWCTVETKSKQTFALDICLRESEKLESYSVEMICTIIIAMEGHLYNILPQEKQETYQSSLAKLKDLLSTCGEHMAMSAYMKTQK